MFQEATRSQSTLIAALALFALPACSVVENPTPLGSAQTVAGSPQGKYRIQRGDGLDVRFVQTPELNVELPVRPDGYISLLYAQEVEAAGKTPEELQAELTRRMSPALKNPEIAVIVRSFATHQAHVGGQVERPGVVPLAGSTTVLESLFAAGGILPSARLDEVLVVRRKPDHSYAVIPVNLETVLDGSDTTQNIALLPFDIVFVPNSPIANVNEFVDLYIRKNIPIQFAVRPEPF
jgi:protein involved in polysaccharide export with SLBB domain